MVAAKEASGIVATTDELDKDDADDVGIDEAVEEAPEEYLCCPIARG